MSYKFFSSYFLITLAAVTFAAGLVWLDSFRVYRAEVTVLVVEKGSAANTTVAATLAELSKNLSFYDAVLKQSELLSDPFVGETPDQRKAGWHTRAVIKESKKSGVLSIQSFGENQGEAKLLATSTVATLFDQAARYYDVKAALDLRVVDGPIVTPTIESWTKFSFASFFSGLAITLLFFMGLSLIDRLMGNRAPLLPVFSTAEKNEAHISADTFKPTVPAGWKIQEGPENVATFEEPEASIEPLGSMEPMVSSEVEGEEARMTGAAPANLPILEDTSLTPLQGAMARLVKEDIDEAARQEATEPVFGEEGRTPEIGEPSQEEYKRRLNSLLSGKSE